MKKDVYKLFSRTITTYLFILCITLAIKILGLDYFGLDLSNPFLLKLNTLMNNNFIINNIIYLIPLCINHYIILSITCDDNSKKMIKYNLCLLPIFYILECTKLKLFGNLSSLIEILYFCIIILIYNKCININIIKRYIKVMIMLYLSQLFSVLTRYNYSVEYVTNNVANILLNFDYIIMLIIIYKLHFMKGDEKLCGYQVAQSSSLQKQTSLKKRQKQSQTKSLKTNKDKFEFILYWILYLSWNIFTVFVVLLVAFINDTIIECIFILSSFWLNKTVFGKPFHLKNATQCFIVSNLTYYCLNRITGPLNISILIPIFLGVLLSWFTSKLVKKTEKILHRGMSEDELKYYFEKISNNTLDYKICKLYYVDRYSEIKVASMTNYSVENIKKRKKIINDKLKELII